MVAGKEEAVVWPCDGRDDVGDLKGSDRGPPHVTPPDQSGAAATLGLIIRFFQSFRNFGCLGVPRIPGIHYSSGRQPLGTRLSLALINVADRKRKCNSLLCGC